MAEMKTTRWTAPCGCRLTYDWDPALPEEDRVHHNFKTEVSCEKHAHHKTCGDRYRAMIAHCCGE